MTWRGKPLGGRHAYRIVAQDAGLVLSLNAPGTTDNQCICLDPRRACPLTMGRRIAAFASSTLTRSIHSRCLGVPNSDVDQVAEGHSGDFDQGAAEISSSATSFRSHSVVDADAAALQSSKASPCAEQLVRRTLVGAVPAGRRIESVSFKLTPDPGVASPTSSRRGPFASGQREWQRG